ncbi:MAG: ATP-binding protein [Bilifractor sp.]|jgi:hypothetical protein
MNIAEAKQQIRQAVAIYLAKDEYGNYRIPTVQQRPVFLLGAPGIGKTAIMEQVAREMDIALVSYSMTHHTRQSALGLPFIVKKNYGGEEVDVSMYTMSEIIASVYETMEKSGKKEGILFLDEINCVSETLGPSMLQFLQYKTFGNRRIPKGWVIVTAGNPPEYNRASREFDIATLDRLKVMEVEPDYETWKNYARKAGIHRSILTWLDIRNEDFYRIETTVDGKQYVTARGWEDLSKAIYLYEEMGFTVDETLVSQYIRDRRICGEFSSYYELYNKYRTDYQVDEILHGREPEEVRRRAGSASFDERITIMGLLLEALLPEIGIEVETEESLKKLHKDLAGIKKEIASDPSAGPEMVTSLLDRIADGSREEMEKKEAANSLTEEQQRSYAFPISFVASAKQKLLLQKPEDADGAFSVVSADYAARVKKMQDSQKEISFELENLFRFVENNFGTGNEMLVLVTNLTVGKQSAKFISLHGCDPYYRYNQKFMLNERGGELMREAAAFEES